MFIVQKNTVTEAYALYEMWETVSIGLSTHTASPMSHRNVFRGYIILIYSNSNHLISLHSEKVVCFQCVLLEAIET